MCIRDRDEIQCTISNLELPISSLKFGKSQVPELWDYADGINTLEFLKGLNG